MIGEYIKDQNDHLSKEMIIMFKMFLTAAFTVYNDTLTAAYHWQRSFTYFPDPRPTPLPTFELPTVEEVTLKAGDGETLVAWTIPPKLGKPVILYFHGNAGNFSYGRIQRFRELTAGGAGLFAVNYRGYGGSTGQPTEAGLHLDAEAAYQAAADRYGGSRLVGYGESLGTGVAVLLATIRPLKAIVLEAPYTSLVSVAQRAFPWLPISVLMIDQFRSDQAIRKINAPLLIIHGEMDNVVPFKEGQMIFEMAHGPKAFLGISAGGHINLYNLGAGKAAREFLQEF